MEKFEIGDIWWLYYPYSDNDNMKHRPGIIIDNDNIAVLAIYVTSKNKDNPYSIEITDWQEAGLKKESWARIDRIVRIKEIDIDRKMGHLSDRDFIKISQLLLEISKDVTHEFSLLAIQNSNNQFLQIYDERWGYPLFPYVRSSDDNNKEIVDSFAGNLLGENVTTTYVAVAKHCKYSESDKVYKVYKHKLYYYRVGDNVKALNDSRFIWKTIDELEQNNEIMRINGDVIRFVKASL